MSRDSDEPLALAYDPAALQRLPLFSDDPALLEQKTGHITAEQFEAKTVRLYVDLGAQHARLICPDGELSFPVSTGNGRLPKHVWTPPGYYDVDKEGGRYRVYKMWRSRHFEDAPMPDSMFFKDGKAAHAATGKEITRLGTVPQSHGCVRMPPEMAARFRALTLQYGPENVGFYVFGVEKTRPTVAAKPRPKPKPRPQRLAPLNIVPPSVKLGV